MTTIQQLGGLLNGDNPETFILSGQISEPLQSVTANTMKTSSGLQERLQWT
jgi:hypothetical protein